MSETDQGRAGAGAGETGAAGSRTHRIGVIPGDGIGIEVTAEALKVLRAVGEVEGLDFRLTEYDLGARQYLASGEALPDQVMAELRGHD
ncbi:MAG: isocitrate/isopropylmalate family dehydrogenase, partial [Candidatus Nanopelagicales bacterium]|nr:isocitrate/isopropylmalate family dehydrogenase [Candidatus Nanopelagicales bacterium]